MNTKVRVGGGGEDAPAERAHFHYPRVAFKRGVPAIEPHAFWGERAAAMTPNAPTGLIALDRREALGVAWAATLPTMLARYIVLRAGASLSHTFASNGEAYYVIGGAGVSDNGDEPVAWEKGDAFCLAGSRRTTHRAAEHSVLLLCTNEPEFNYLRARPDPDALALRPTLFRKAAVERELASIQADVSDDAAGKAVILVTTAMRDRIAATPTLSMTFNSLGPGEAQRQHKHASAALTLCITAEGVHSMVDGQRIDWAEGLVMLTPPLAPHSHHNGGASTMLSFVVQDSPLHAELRTSNFQFVEQPA